MHELGLAQQIARIALAALPASSPLPRVQAIYMRLGKLTAVVPDSLRFCFEVVTQDTPLAGARLEIEEVPLRGKCQACGATSVLDDLPFTCRTCQSGRLEFISGRELQVMSLDVADD